MAWKGAMFLQHKKRSIVESMVLGNRREEKIGGWRNVDGRKWEPTRGALKSRKKCSNPHIYLFQWVINFVFDCTQSRRGDSCVFQSLKLSILQLGKGRVSPWFRA